MGASTACFRLNPHLRAVPEHVTPRNAPPEMVWVLWVICPVSLYWICLWDIQYLKFPFVDVALTDDGVFYKLEQSSP